MQERVLRLIGRGKNIWVLLKESGLTVRDFVKVMNKLYEKGLIEVKNNYVKPKAKVLEEEKINYAKLEKKFKKAVKDRPRAKIEYFQGWVTSKSIVKRIKFMHECDGLKDKNIVLIGDDDLLSIALALTDLPKRIVVLDIDERLGKFIENFNKKYKKNIEFVEYDVANPLPKKLVSKFHIFSTEPLESYTGFLAFLTRGAASLKKNGSGYIGLTRAEVGLKKWQLFEKMMLDMNFVITDLLRDFSEYEIKSEPNAYDWWVKKFKFKVTPTLAINWYTSWLIRIEAVGKPNPKIKPNQKIKIDFVSQEEYTHPLSQKSKAKI